MTALLIVRCLLALPSPVFAPLLFPRTPTACSSKPHQLVSHRTHPSCPDPYVSGLDARLSSFLFPSTAVVVFVLAMVVSTFPPSVPLSFAYDTLALPALDP
jgi:hypothetical protein